MMKHGADGNLQWSHMLICSAPAASTYCLAPSVPLVFVVQGEKNMNNSALELVSYPFKKIFPDFWTTKLQHIFFLAADSQQQNIGKSLTALHMWVSSSYLAQILRRSDGESLISSQESPGFEET